MTQIPQEEPKQLGCTRLTPGCARITCTLIGHRGRLRNGENLFESSNVFASSTMPQFPDLFVVYLDLKEEFSKAPAKSLLPPHRYDWATDLLP